MLQWFKQKSLDKQDRNLRDSIGRLIRVAEEAHRVIAATGAPVTGKLKHQVVQAQEAVYLDLVGPREPDELVDEYLLPIIRDPSRPSGVRLAVRHVFEQFIGTSLEHLDSPGGSGVKLNHPPEANDLTEADRTARVTSLINRLDAMLKGGKIENYRELKSLSLEERSEFKSALVLSALQNAPHRASEMRRADDWIEYTQRLEEAWEILTVASDPEDRMQFAGHLLVVGMKMWMDDLLFIRKLLLELAADAGGDVYVDSRRVFESLKELDREQLERAQRIAGDTSTDPVSRGWARNRVERATHRANILQGGSAKADQRPPPGGNGTEGSTNSFAPKGATGHGGGTASPTHILELASLAAGEPIREVDRAVQILNRKLFERIHRSADSQSQRTATDQLVSELSMLLLVSTFVFLELGIEMSTEQLMKLTAQVIRGFPSRQGTKESLEIMGRAVEIAKAVTSPRASKGAKEFRETLFSVVQVLVYKGGVEPLILLERVFEAAPDGVLNSSSVSEHRTYPGVGSSTAGPVRLEHDWRNDRCVWCGVSRGAAEKFGWSVCDSRAV